VSEIWFILISDRIEILELPISSGHQIAVLIIINVPAAAAAAADRVHSNARNWRQNTG